MESQEKTYKFMLCEGQSSKCMAPREGKKVNHALQQLPDERKQKKIGGHEIEKRTKELGKAPRRVISTKSDYKS